MRRLAALATLKNTAGAQVRVLPPPPPVVSPIEGLIDLNHVATTAYHVKHSGAKC